MPVAAVWMNAETILLWLKQLPCVVRLTGQYLRIYILALPVSVYVCVSIVYTPRARLLSDLATECCRHEVTKSLGNQARGVQPTYTMTTQNSKIRLISSIALKSRLITYLST